MASKNDRIRSLVPDGTIIRVDRVGNEYAAIRTDTGEDITGLVRRYVRKKAWDGRNGLRLVHTKTGGVQFRKVPLDEVPAISVETESEPEVGVAADPAGPMTHAQIVSFIESAYERKPDLLVMSEVRWKYVMRSAVRGKNLMFVGPAGCGKTLACQSVAETFPDRDYFYFNLGASQDPRGMLIGNTHFSPEQGTFVSEALFVKAIQTPNAIILLDEFSRAHDDASNILMTVLDQNQRYLRIDEKPDTPTIRVAPGVVFLATANIGNEYTGTRVMDRALLDRFSIIEMEPLNLEEESGLLNRLYPSLPESLTKAIAEIATHTRDQILSDDPKISTIVSTRASVEIASLIHDGFTLAEAAEVCIYPFFDQAGGADSERVYMKQLVQRFISEAETADKASPWASADDGDSSAAAGVDPRNPGLNKNPW